MTHTCTDPPCRIETRPRVLTIAKPTDVVVRCARHDSVDALEATLEMALETLDAYGYHVAKCDAYEGDAVPCTCGWTEALAAAKGGPA